MIPPAIAPQTPATGPSCEISPKARAKGNAIIATVIPERISALTLVCRLFIFSRGLNSFKLFLIISPIFSIL